MVDYSPLTWLGFKLLILDQTKLPQREVYLELTRYQQVAMAIKELKVRGAPAIGVAAAYGIVLGALEIDVKSREAFLRQLKVVIETFASTRPTAKNLFRAIQRMQTAAQKGKEPIQIARALIDEAEKIQAEEIEATREISRLGAELIKDGSTILTHCNTGPLATTGKGTALGVLIQANTEGKRIHVMVTETRPLLQGARLTAWELKKAEIPFTLVTDSMAGYFMKQGKVDVVIVGADCIAANGDTANKIGTYTLAVLAKEHSIPFYVAAPTTTIDPAIATGDGITIEERNPEEVTRIRGVAIAPADIQVANPAFDVTPHHLITAIITEKGILREPYGEGIRANG
jgi:methylthioribose-1-phosphate isomerase